MGSSRNRSRKKKRIPPYKRAKQIEDGGPNYKDPGPSSKKISKNTAIESGIFANMDTELNVNGNIVLTLQRNKAVPMK